LLSGLIELIDCGGKERGGVLEGGQRMGEAATTPRGLTHRHCPTKVLATALEGAVDEPRWLLVLLLINRLVVVLKWLVLVELLQLGCGLLDIIPVGRDERREVLVRGERHEEQHELDEDYYDLPDQTNNSSRGGGAGDTKNDDQEDLGEEVDRREVLPHTRRQKLDEENYEKFQCDIDDTRDDSSRYVV
jgi:hypothetical protein